MPCLVGCLALFFPRLALVLIWLFGAPYLQSAYQHMHWIWPILGFLFLPFTTLAYAVAWHMGGGHITGLGMALIVLAVLVDVGTLGGSASHKQVRRYYVVKR